jgi:Mg-chelatase subunit ChlD
MATTRTFARTAIALAIALCAPAAGRAQTPAKLKIAVAPVLLDCRNQVCFRLLVNAYDASDRPIAIPERAPLEVFEGGIKHPVFFSAVVETKTEAANTQSRYTFLVVDTSGSMLEPVLGGSETKFEAARAAIREHLVGKLQDGVDRIAIAGFDSSRVKERIAAAPLRTRRADALGDLAALRPSPRGNTALYSAVDFALDRLEEVRADAEKTQAEVMLVVFTDGANDVHPERGDDPGLLTEAEGLQRVLDKAARRARDLPLRIITVGLEGRRTFNQDALRKLAFPSDSGTYFTTRSADELAKTFSTIAGEKANRMFLTVGPVRPSRDEIAGRPIALTVRWGDLSDTAQWEAPPVGTPARGAALTPAESRALPVPRGGGSPWWWLLVRRLVIMATYSLVLALLWFGLPRLIWPERYAPAAARAGALPRSGGAARPGRGAPPARPAGGDVTVIARPGAQSAAAAGSAPVPRAARPPAPRPGVPTSAAPPPRPARPTPADRVPPRPARPAPQKRQDPDDPEMDDATVFLPKKPPRE